MKKQNLYNVTVYATLSKDVLVYAENEDAALNYVQDVCDNTDLISFDGREILDVTAEDVEEIDPAGVGEPSGECCENCRGNRAFCAGCGGENFGSLTEEQQKKYLELYRWPERFFRVGGEIQAVQIKPADRGDAR